MQWDPRLLVVPDLALWQMLLVWLIGLPLLFLLFLALTVSGIISVQMTEVMMQRQMESAGPIKRMFLLFFVAPVLAIAGQIILCIGMLSILAGGDRQ